MGEEKMRVDHTKEKRSLIFQEESKKGYEEKVKNKSSFGLILKMLGN